VTEVEQETERVRLRQIAAQIVPAFCELGGIRKRQKVGIPIRGRVIVESEIGRVELFLQNRHPRKQGHRSALSPVRRPQENLSFALEVCPGDSAADVFREGNGAVIQSQMQVGPVDGRARTR